MAGGFGGRPQPGEEVDLGPTEEDEDPFFDEDAEGEGGDGGEDDGGEPPDGGERPDGGEDGEPDGQRRPAPSSAVGRGGRKTPYQRALDRANREWQQRYDDLERRIGAAQQPIPTRPDPAATAAAEERELAYVATLPYEQQGRYWADKALRTGEQRFNAALSQIGDQNDARDWNQSMRTDPRRARYATEVERTIRDERARGNTMLTRENVYYWALGRDLDNRARQQAAGQRRQGQRRLQQQRTTPANGAGDARRPAGRQGEDTYEASLNRLRGQPL